MPAVDHRVVDEWFRDHGLPTLVPVRRWADDLPERVAPLQVFLVGLLLGVSTLLWAAGMPAPDVPVDGNPAVVVTVYAVLLIVPGLLGWWVRHLLTKLPQRFGTTAAWVVIVAGEIVAVVVGARLQPEAGWWYQIWTEAVWLLGTFAFVWAGGGSLLIWTMRSALSNLGAIRHMASIALPVILMLVIFAFFSAEIWQLTDNLGWPRLFGVGVVIALTAVVAVLPAVRRSALGEPVEIGDTERRTLLTGLGLPVRPVTARPLSWLQKANVLLVMLVAQLLLGAIFSAALGTLLVILGDVALTTATQAAWIGHDPEPVVLSRSALPVTVNLLKASAFLGMISALTFVISAVSDAQYREHFFDPILQEVRRALLVDSARRGDQRLDPGEIARD